MSWDRMDAIEAMSPEDRRALVERLAWELVQPGGMSKRDAIPHTPSKPVPFVPVKRPRKTVEHGTISGYTYGRCRCNDCRAAKARYQRVNSEKLSHERMTTFSPVRADFPRDTPEPKPEPPPPTPTPPPVPISPQQPFERRPFDPAAARARACDAMELL